MAIVTGAISKERVDYSGRNPFLRGGENLYEVEKIMEMVRLYGDDLVLGLESPSVAVGIITALQSRGHDRIPEVLVWNDRFCSLTGREQRPTLGDLILMHSVGVRPEEAASGLLDGMTVKQIIGRQQGIAQPVSEGWL
jgi:hypothetical protein